MAVATDEILLRAQKALDESQFNDIRVLHVEQVEGALLICGVVRSYYHKQQAQEAVRAESGGLPVNNQVIVEALPTQTR